MSLSKIDINVIASNTHASARFYEKIFEANPIIRFEKLTDKSAIATPNITQSGYADDSYRFYKFIRNGTLHTLEKKIDKTSYPKNQITTYLNYPDFSDSSR